MTRDRHLDWEGCWNARELGGLPAAGERTIRHGAVVRASTLHTLTDAGWRSLEEHGVQTVVDLRTTERKEPYQRTVPDSVTCVGVPLEDGLIEDPEFHDWASRGWLSTPLYYPRFVERWPDRCAEAVREVAYAGPGGVVVHCGAGRDRTGLIVALLLSLVDTPVEAIASDYLLTRERLDSDRARRLGVDNENDRIDTVLTDEGTTLRRAFLDFMTSTDPEAVLREGGLEDEELHTIRRRLLGEKASGIS